MFQGMFAIITPGPDARAPSPSACASAPTSPSSAIWLLVVYVPLAHMVWGGGWIGARSRRASTSRAASWSTCRAASRRSSQRSILGKRTRLRPRADAAPQPAADRDRRRPALGRLVRLQRRQRARRRRHRRPRLPHHPHRRRHGRRSSGCRSSGSTAASPRSLGAATGAVAGLVAITPACALRRRRWAPSPSASARRSSATCAVTILKPALGYDDSLDVFGVHGVGGIWGALATGALHRPCGVTGGRPRWRADLASR